MAETGAGAGPGAVCRTCLGPQALAPLFPDPARHHSYELALRLCTGLQMDHKDGLPLFICMSCNQSIESCMLFRFQSRIANQKLQQLYKETNSADNAFETNPLSFKSEDLPTTSDLKLEAKLKLSEFFKADISKECKTVADASPVKFESHSDKNSDHILDTDDILVIKERDILNCENHHQDILNKVEITLKREISDTNDMSEAEGCNLSDSESVHDDIIPNKVEIILENVMNGADDNLDQFLQSDHDTLNVEGCAIPTIQNVQNGLVVCKLSERIAYKGQMKENNAFLCKVCQETFKDIKMFVKHAQGHQALKHVCEYCKEKFDTRTYLVHHIQKAHAQQIKSKSNSSTRPVKGEATKTNADKPHEFRRKCSELIEGADDQNSDIKCKLCHNTYKDMRRFRLHAQRHLGYRNVCEYCQKGYQARYFLLRHIKNNHSGDHKSKRSSSVPAPEGNNIKKRQYNSKKRKKICEKYLERIEGDSDGNGDTMQCKLCHSTYKSMDMFMKHAQSHLGHRNVCQHCKKAFDSRTYLVRHIKKKHSQAIAEKPSTCIVPIRDNAIIQNTDKPHEYRRKCLELIDGPRKQNMRNVKCKLCHNTYRDMDTFRRHAQKHLGYKNVCEYCHKGYQARFFLLRHIKREHTDARKQTGPLKNTDKPEEFRKKCSELIDGPYEQNSKNVKCRLCHNTYRDMDTFRRHAQKHLGYRNVCEYCQKPYQARFFLLRHIQKNHLSQYKESDSLSPPPVQSDQTEKPNEFRQKCLDLIEGPYDMNSQNVQCKVCKAVRKTVSSFVNHAQIHLGFRHLCEFCAKGYPSKAGLKRHLQAFHGLARELSCSFCDYKAIFRNQLKIHERRFHTKERPFVCETCGAAYFSKSVLTQHIQLRHQTERRYKCKECSRSFKLLRELTYHQKLVHQLACTYLCHICNSRFQAPRSVRNHYLKIHKIPRAEQVDKIQRFYFVQPTP